MGKVPKFKWVRWKREHPDHKSQPPLVHPWFPTFPENSFSLVQISKGGRATNSLQDRVRTEGGTDGPQLRLPCNPLAIGIRPPNGMIWSISISQKKETVRSNDVTWPDHPSHFGNWCEALTIRGHPKALPTKLCETECGSRTGKGAVATLISSDMVI
jgi:hypothetical protein